MTRNTIIFYSSVVVAGLAIMVGLIWFLRAQNAPPPEPNLGTPLSSVGSAPPGHGASTTTGASVTFVPLSQVPKATPNPNPPPLVPGPILGSPPPQTSP